MRGEIIVATRVVIGRPGDSSAAHRGMSSNRGSAGLGARLSQPPMMESPE